MDKIKNGKKSIYADGNIGTNQNKKEAEEAIKKLVKESVRRLELKAALSKDCGDIYEDLKKAVEYVSNGTNTVIMDDYGMPSIMVRVDRMKISSLLEGGSERIHPAFVLNSKALDCIYISKYQNVVYNGHAYSLPALDPACNISYDEACLYSSSKGIGWGLTSFSMRAAVALWSKKNGTLPHGNNDSGKDFYFKNETGNPTEDGRVATGSGPVGWSHNNKPDGIFDLNGNLNEWDTGMRLVNGEINIIPGIDSMNPSADLSYDSKLWKAIMPDGTFVVPGTKGVLHYSGTDDKIILTDCENTNKNGPFNCAFKDIATDDGLGVPEILKALMLFPETKEAEYGGGWRWVRTGGECFPLCGGAHRAVDHAGIFFVGTTYPRTHKYALSGFRSAYVPIDNFG